MGRPAVRSHAAVDESPDEKEPRAELAVCAQAVRPQAERAKLGVTRMNGLPRRASSCTGVTFPGAIPHRPAQCRIRERRGARLASPRRTPRVKARRKRRTSGLNAPQTGTDLHVRRADATFARAINHRCPQCHSGVVAVRLRRPIAPISSPRRAALTAFRKIVLGPRDRSSAPADSPKCAPTKGAERPKERP